MKIKLTKGKHATVDPDDFDRLSNLKWHCSTNGYANTRIYVKGKSVGLVGMHRLIMGAQKGQEVDHINGEPLDNRKENLRICSRQENCRNTKMPTTNSSGFKGVFWKQHAKKWQAQISHNDKSYHLGYYKTPIEAAKAYNTAAGILYGSFARKNEL